MPKIKDLTNKFKFDSHRKDAKYAKITNSKNTLFILTSNFSLYF